MSALLSTFVLFGNHDGTAVVSGGGLIQGLIFLVVVGIILGIILWLVDKAPFIPALFKQIITWIVYVVAAIILINFLLGLTGHPIFVAG
jgi:hypothetical protein